MTQSTYCNVCDFEILDSSSNRCPSCGVFLNPVRNPIQSFDSRVVVDTQTAAPLTLDPLADEPDLFDEEKKTEPQKDEVTQNDIITFGPVSEKNSSGSRLDLDSLDSSNQEIEIINIADNKGDVWTDEELTKDKKNSTVSATPRGVKSEMELGAEEESWTSEEQNPGSPFPGATISGGHQPVAEDFAYLKRYRAKSFQFSALALVIWSILISWKTAWCLFPANASFILAIIGLVYQRSRTGWIALGLSVVAIPVLWFLHFGI